MHSSLAMHLLGKSVGMVAWVVIGEDVQGVEWLDLEFLSDFAVDGFEDFRVTCITEVLGAAYGVRVKNGKGCFEISAKRDARGRIESCFGGARIQDGKSHGACATCTANGSGVGESCCSLGEVYPNGVIEGLDNLAWVAQYTCDSVCVGGLCSIVIGEHWSVGLVRRGYEDCWKVAMFFQGLKYKNMQRGVWKHHAKGRIDRIEV